MNKLLHSLKRPACIALGLLMMNSTTFASDVSTQVVLADREAILAEMIAYDPSIKVIICTPTLAPNQNLLTGDTSNYQCYDCNIKLATYYLLKAYDNDESLERNIYIAPMTLT